MAEYKLLPFFEAKIQRREFNGVLSHNPFFFFLPSFGGSLTYLNLLTGEERNTCLGKLV